MNRDLFNNVKSVSSIRPAAAHTATINGQEVDTQGFESCMIEVQTGVITDGVFDITLEETDTSGSGYTAVAAADRLGSLPSIIATSDNVAFKFGYIGNKRYLRVVATESTASTGAFFTANVLLSNPRHAPAA